jgi:amino acid adenylation domain-containing protein
MAGLSEAKRLLLARRLAGTAAGAVRPGAIPRRADAGPAPLSFAQERLWLLDQLEAGGAGYNVPLALRLEGPLDVDALRRALADLVRRHESLRTVFPRVDGEPAQVVSAPGELPLPVDDLRGAGDDEVRRRVREETARPFDLAAGPLFRARLLRVGDEDHVLVACMHHVVTDGWSMGVFFRELSALYGAFREGRPSPLPEPEVQYADYAVWQRRQLGGSAPEAQLAYWKDALAGAPPVLELPTDHPRPPVRGGEGGRVRVTIGEDGAAGVRALARAENATPYMVLLAAWALLLGRYAGQEDVVIGSPIAGRERQELEGVIGFFANTLAMRADLSGAPSFRQLVGRVRETALGAYAHAELPFERLVQEIQPVRSLAHTPLFQAMFVLQNAPAAGRIFPGLRVRGVEGAGTTAKFDLTLSLAESPQGFSGQLDFPVELFETDTVERLVHHFGVLLAAAVAEPERPITALPLMDDAERRRVLEEWNDTAAPAPEDALLHARFARQAARTANAVAVEGPGGTLTYADLDARSSRLAHHLRSRGAGPERTVGVMLDRSPELVVALLGVLEAGAAYVPLDPAYPAERLGAMLRDSGARLLLTRGARGTALGEAEGVEVVCLERDADAIAAQPTDAPDVAMSPGNAAYVIYTSGSTGQPKGVVVTHGGLLRQRAVPLAADDRVLQGLSFAFDPSVWELFAPLLAGARVVVPPAGITGDGEVLARFMAEWRVTTLQIPPSLLSGLVEAPGLEACRALRRVFSGGEPLPAELARRLTERLPVELYNCYGPTEASIDVAGCRVDDPRAPITIGRPVHNARVFLLDARMEPVPIGVPGELYAGGVGVARGYLGSTGRTAERFVPDPFSGEPGARLYRTGDRARWRADGTLEFMGRVDHQVKIRGCRIEPGEVESALRAHPSVQEAAVVARADGGEARLVAYAAPREVDAGALLGFLKGRLPAHMLPAAIVVLDRLPLAPNGKVDRFALPAPGAEEAREYAAPRNALEERLAAIFAEVLEAGRVGIHDDFFQLGGHSLLATRVVSRVREAFGVELPLRTVFDASTVAALAPHVEALRGAPPAPPAAGIVAVSRDAYRARGSALRQRSATESTR